MNILIADKLDKQAHESLEHMGCIVLADASLSEERLIDAIKEHRADLLVVRSTKVKKNTSMHLPLSPSSFEL